MRSTRPFYFEERVTRASWVSPSESGSVAESAKHFLVCGSNSKVALWKVNAESTLPSHSASIQSSIQLSLDGRTASSTITTFSAINARLFAFGTESGTVGTFSIVEDEKVRVHYSPHSFFMLCR